MVPGRQTTIRSAPGSVLAPVASPVVLPLLAGALLSYGSATILTILCGRMGLNLSPSLARFIIILSLLSGVLYGWSLRPPAPGRSREPLPGSARWVLVSGVIFYLLLWAVAYILPDAENDGLWYHNPALHFWALAGRVHWITADPEPFWNDLIRYAWNGYAKGVECIGFLFLRAVPVSRLLNGINLTIVPLGCLGIAALTRFLGGSRFSAVLSGVLFLFVPVVIGHASNLYIDASVASFQIALFAVTAFTIRSLENGCDPKGLLPALGCSLGLALGAKGTSVILLLLVPALLAVYWFRSARLSRSRDETGKRLTIFIVLTVLVAFSVGGYWYLRNYLHTGRPLYPVGPSLAGREIFPGAAVPEQFPPPDTPLTKHWPQVFRVLYSWLDAPHEWHLAMTEVSHNSGGLGLLWLFGGLPALVWLVITIIRRRSEELPPGIAAAWIGLLIMGVVIFFFMPPRHNHKARYVIWLYGLGIPAFFLAAERIWRSSSSVRRRWGKVWVLAILGVFLAEGFYSFVYHVRRISLARQGVREGDFQAAHLLRAAREPYPPGYFFPELRDSLLGVMIRNREPVALGELNRRDEQRQIVGHLTQGEAFGIRPIYFLSRETASDPEGISRFIRERRIRYVIWNPDIPVPPALGRIVHIWDRMPYWYYLLAVSPDAAPPARGGWGWAP